MQVISYTHDGLVLLLNSLRIQLNKPAINLLAWLMQALLEKTKAHLFAMADKLPDDCTTDRARQQRIRRFLSHPKISPHLFVPALVALVRPLATDAPFLQLVIDRTEWVRRGVPVNVLDVALSYQGRAIPLFWIVSNRKGVSSVLDWKAALTPVIEALRAAPWTDGKLIEVLADREFASPKLSLWLWETYRVGSTLRLKKSEYLQTAKASCPVRAHFERLSPGQCRFLRDVTVTKASDLLLNVALWWGKGYDEPWALMTTNRNLPTTIGSYRKRFGIEPMHKDWKSNAFEIEGTKVTSAKRIETLLIPIALCYVLCVLEGNRQEVAGEAVKAHKTKRTKGLFLVGLAAFCRVLRATHLSRIQQFFERLFVAWGWPEILALTLNL